MVSLLSSSWSVSSRPTARLWSSCQAVHEGQRSRSLYRLWPVVIFSHQPGNQHLLLQYPSAKAGQTFTHRRNIRGAGAFIYPQSSLSITVVQFWLANRTTSTLYKHLQLVLRSAAWLVLKLASRDSVTDLMRDRPHWLCFPYRVTFKLCVFAYKCQHGLAPGYLAQFCRPVSTVAYRSPLWSAAVGQLEVPLIHTVTYGERNFAYSCPTAWNNLPSELKGLHREMSLHTFKRLVSPKSTIIFVP